MKLEKECAGCERKLEIIVNKDKSYSGGHYFGRMTIPDGKGRYIRIRSSRVLGGKVNIYKWTGKYKKVEYWECNKCYKR